MSPENYDIFIKWLYKKYNPDNFLISLEDIVGEKMTEEWLANEEKEFRKYHPSAGTFVKTLTTDEFMDWINKHRNK